MIVKLSNRLSALRRNDAAHGAPILDTVSLVEYDRAWATENRERLLKQWEATVGR